MRLTNNFTSEEMACKCGCGASGMDMGFMIKLQEARNLAGVPFKVSSGFRCQKHNAAEGGVSDSAHTKGCAADIATPDDFSRMTVLQSLVKAGFRRIGIANSFVHCDTDDTKPQNMIWLYNH